MNYEIAWKLNYSIVTFNGELSIRDIESANKAIHGDSRTYKTFGSIWDFSNCTTNKITPKDLLYTEANDLGSTTTIKEFNLAIITNDSHSISLFESYISNSIDYGSPWKFKLFSSLNQADSWINSQCPTSVE